MTSNNIKSSNHPFSQEIPGLLQRHDDEHIVGSGISKDVAIERGYRSGKGIDDLKKLGFSKKQLQLPTLVIPIHTVDGSSSFHIHRPDNPRKDKTGKPLKYENPEGKGLRVDVPPRCRENLKNPKIRLFITEGVKKADAIASHSECVIDLLGVYGFKHKNEFGATTISADFDYIAWQEREVFIVYDNDVMTNPKVKKALNVLTEHIKRKGAVVHHVYIPFSNGKKVGADDFLLDHTVDELLSNAVKQEEGGALQESSPAYTFDDQKYLCRVKSIDNNEVLIRLANFDARIISEKKLDNGLEVINHYTIEGKNKKRHLGFVDIPAASFTSMNWVPKLGYEAIIEPGHNTKDYVRHYIQTCSKPELVITYTHTGWRTEGEKYFYITAGGAIGKDNVTVNLSHELQRYSLPAVSENEIESIKASLSFIDIGKHEITIPLLTYTYLAILTSLLTPLPNFSFYIYGPTGVFKTTLSILMLAHFGNFDSIENLSNFEDTGNMLGRRAFTLKDTLMVADDYHPSTQRYIYQNKEALAQRIIREFSNRTERGRLNPDSTEKVRYSPRGMLVITGEELISLQSTLARVCVIEMNKGDIDTMKLTELQNSKHLLPHAMCSYINWLIEYRIENIQNSFSEVFPQLRSKASTENDLHTKLPEQVAFMQFSLSTILNWLLDKKVITESIARELKDEGWTIFTSLAKEHSKRIKSEDPVNKFIDIINSLIFQKKVCIENKEFGGETLGGDTQNGRAELIGYCDDIDFYFLPTPLWNAIYKYSSSSGEYFPVSQRTLYKTLRQRGILKTQGDRNTVSTYINNKQYRVLKISRGVLS